MSPSEMGGAAHVSLSRLESATLTEFESSHIERCAQCRVDRRALRVVVTSSHDDLTDIREARTAMRAARDSGCEALSVSQVTPDSSGRSSPAVLELLFKGRVIDRYTVEALLGRGGMAVVYRVRHNQLGSRHALKLLTRSSPAIQERLIAEGRAQSALGHPNIVTVTDVIDVDGRAGLVMEYVPGPSLEQLLADRPLTMAQADSIVADILPAVAAAHRRGFVHRDLKPANILLQATDDHVFAKVGDFGLAKLLVASEPASGNMTSTGMSMGTPAYMAPEQIRDASRVDTRADVFALGAVLYEIVTSQRAFRGTDVLDVFNRICQGKHEPWPADVPERARLAVEGALVVDRDQRVQDCDALWSQWKAGQDLTAAQHHAAWDRESCSRVRQLTPGTELPAPSRPVVTSRQPHRWRRPAIVFGLFSVVAGLAAILAAMLPDKAHAPDAPWTSEPKVRRVARDNNVQLYPSLSADGRELVYSDEQDILRRRLAGDKALNLTASFEPPAIEPALSPDGESIAFSAGGALFVMGASGENIRKIAKRGFWPRWSPDGQRLVYVTEDVYDFYVRTQGGSELHTVNVESGESTRLIGPAYDVWRSDWSPDGSIILLRTGSGFMSVPATGGRPTPTGVTRGWYPRWDPNGTGFFAIQERGGRFAIVRFDWDADQSKVTGSATVVWTLPTGGGWHFDMSRDQQRWVAAVNTSFYFLLRVRLDPKSGRALGLPRPISNIEYSLTSPSVSPDGSLLIATSYADHEDLFLVDVLDDTPASTKMSTPRPLTAGNDYARAPDWSPDGKSIIYFGSRGGKEGLFTIAADGSNHRLVQEQNYRWPRWAPDGQRLAITELNDDDQLQPMVVKPGDEEPRNYLEPLTTELLGWRAAGWSPDGGRLLLVHHERGVASWTIAERTFTPIADVGTDAVWLRNGNIVIADGRRLLLFETATKKLSALSSIAPTRVNPGAALDASPDDGNLFVSGQLVHHTLWLADFFAP